MPSNPDVEHQTAIAIGRAIVPVITFVFAGLIAIALYFYTRRFWRSFLASSRSARMVYYLIAITLIPVLIGGWSDISDVGQVSLTQFTWTQSVIFSAFAILTVIYLYLHGCWFDHEEQSLILREDEKAECMRQVARHNAERNEAQCQRNYLIHFDEYVKKLFRRCALDAYGVTSRTAQASTVFDDLAIPIQYFPDFLEAVRQAYKHIEGVPVDAKVSGACFREHENTNSATGKRSKYLEPMYSHDGTIWGIGDSEFEKHREFFNLDKPDASVAVASVVTSKPYIVPDTEQAHTDPNHPFKFFSNEGEQRANLKSMIAIPFQDPLSKDRYVLCLACNVVDAFRKEHAWKADQSKSFLSEGVSLIMRTNELVLKSRPQC